MFAEPYMANITIFAGNFAPLSWAFCDGSLQSIAQNTALFALIGTTYGGDGQTTFALPDLRGRIAVHQGQGPGLSNYSLGELSGTENITLLSSQLPVHNHATISITGGPGISTAPGNQPSPVNNVPAVAPNQLYTDTADGFGLGPSTSIATTPIAGGSQPVPNLSPVLAMNYIICVEGIFPSRP
jgi:microcystin-dependent protein